MKIKMTLEKLSRGFQEKDAQLLVILSIVLNLVLSFNPLCV